MEGFKSKLKKAVVYGGMFLGMAQGYDKLKDYNDHATSNDTAQTEEVAEQSLLNTYGKAVETAESYLEEHAKPTFIDNEITNPEDGTVFDPDNIVMKDNAEKEWLLTYMKSPVYREKALAEGLTENQINKRIKRLENTPIFLHDKETLKHGEDGHMSVEFDVANLREFPIVNVATKQKKENVKSTTIHEAQHAVTLGNKHISAKAKKLYAESYIPEVYANARDVQGNNYSEYLKDITERDARKRELEYEAEQMGLIRIGQEVTESDYKNIMDAYRQGKFTYGARQFLETTKPEYFLKIMNEIAENESEDRAPDNLPIENRA